MQNVRTKKALLCVGAIWLCSILAGLSGLIPMEWARVGGPIALITASLIWFAPQSDALLQTQLAETQRLNLNLEKILARQAMPDMNAPKTDAPSPQELAHLAANLANSLTSHSQTIIKLMQTEIAPDAWQAYLNGTSGLFNHMLSDPEKRKLQTDLEQLVQNRPAIEGDIRAYLGLFRQLIQAILADPNGQALTLILLSSDLGRLYVLLDEVAPKARLN